MIYKKFKTKSGTAYASGTKNCYVTPNNIISEEIITKKEYVEKKKEKNNG